MYQRLSRRALLAIAALQAAPVQAKSPLPDKALRILVGFSAGGGGELMAQAVAPRLEQRTSHRVTVENKPSDRKEAAGSYLRQALTEGSVVAFLPTTTIVVTPPREIFPFDARSDLVPLTMAGRFQVALVVAPSTGVTSVAEYCAWVKAGPEERTAFGTSAKDDYLRLYTLAIGQDCGLDLKYRPQKGAAGLVAAVKSGQVPAGIVSVPTLLDHNRKGEVRVLMTSGAARSRVLRTVPTAAEAGHPALELAEWFGFFASSVTPAPVAEDWSRLLQAVLAEDEVAAKLASLGLDVSPTTQAEARTLYTARLKTWIESAARLGVTLPE